MPLEEQKLTGTVYFAKHVIIILVILFRIFVEFMRAYGSLGFRPSKGSRVTRTRANKR